MQVLHQKTVCFFAFCMFMIKLLLLLCIKNKIQLMKNMTDAKRIFSLLLMVSLFMTASAQRMISGTVVDKGSGEGIMMATVMLLKTDSTLITGVSSDDAGKFSLQAPENGDFLVKVSFLGYDTMVKNVHVSDDKDVSLGDLVMNLNAILLKETTVVGATPKVVIKQDTFIYNASAYRTPEGSVIEELVKRLPGAEVGDDGSIKINGKNVDKILVDGKEFMKGDTKTAMKNLPTSIVERVKAYDQQSDLSKVTGIDDGEEKMVLDFGIKKGMNKGFFGNVDLAIGTHGRYSEKLMASYYKDQLKIMLFGSLNNVNDAGFPGGGRGRFGAGRQGLNNAKMFGVNFDFEPSKAFELDGSVVWNHNNSDMNTWRSAENFISRSGAFNNSHSLRYGRSDRWKGNFEVKWEPDTLWNFKLEQDFTLSTNDSRGISRSAAYNEDPYLYSEDPLSQEAIDFLAASELMTNTNRNNQISYSDDKQSSTSFRINRKLGSNGRNLTLRAGLDFSQGAEQALSIQNVHLYLMKNALGNDSTYQTNRYSITPTKNWGYNLMATYSEPLMKATFLQLTYTFRYNYRKSDRSTYGFSNLGETFFDGIAPAYRGWDSYLSRLVNPLESYWDADQSRFSEYKNFVHDIRLMLRMNRSQYRLNAGVMLQPQQSQFVQNYQGIYVDTTRNVFNVSPTIDLRYRFSKISELRVNYRGNSSQPGMAQLLDITDDSDPLNISKGNPGLKPAFINNLRVFYNNYFPNHQRSLMVHLNYSNTRNSISNMVTYDEKTGARTTRPENINGNWDLSGALMFNTSLDSVGKWNLNTFTTYNYNNYVGYINLHQLAVAQKSTTRSSTLGERLSASYRNAWLDVEVDGSVAYTHSKNALQAQYNLNTWEFSYGTTINVTMPWGMTLSTDLHENSRRGYNDRSMNTDELIWNAQVSQGFLKGNALTMTLQFYDILHNQSNFSRTVNAMQRSDVRYNSITSYIMLHAIYRFNAFGGKQAREKMEKNRPDGRRERRAGRGFGGGRLPMGGGFYE